MQIAGALLAAFGGGALGGTFGAAGAGAASWDTVGKAISKELAKLPKLDAISLGNFRDGNSPEAILLRKLRFDSAKSKFYGNPADIGLKVVQSARETEGVFCQLVRPKLEEYAAYLRSFSQQERQVVANRGDSLWGIAERYYGNGRYFLTIAENNFGSLKNTPKVLQPGQSLLVVPMHELLLQPYIVNAGDTLWSIAKSGGRVLSPTALATMNASQVPDPDRIYPLQRLRLVERKASATDPGVGVK